MGAEPLSDGSTHFRVWSPDRARVDVVVEGAEVRLSAEGDGWHSGVVDGVGAGARYSYRLDGEDRLLPDPASRFQPDGVHGPSEVIDPSTFAWTDDSWPGVQLPGQVVYEMHVGTFTPEGTWEAAAARLAQLADTGITLLEVMPWFSAMPPGLSRRWMPSK